MSDRYAPYHAHVYFTGEEQSAASTLRDQFMALSASGDDPPILFVGAMTDTSVGPHPLPQYEVHFLESSLSEVIAVIEASGLRALVHPLTNDDLADHTALAQWIGEPLDLDLGVLDPPGRNQGIPRFGRSDF